VVFVEADSFNVIPGGCLMAEETLIDLGLFHASDAHRDHFEVHHIVTGRGLVALGA
jgi:hypothetical protein